MRASYFDVAVTSFASSEAQTEKTYVLFPANEEIEGNELEFREFSGYLKRALSERGFSQAKDRKHADVAIFLSYEVHSSEEYRYTNYTRPRHSFMRSVSIYAYDIRNYRHSHKLTESWRTLSMSIGPSGDLRRVLPILIAAAEPYLGKSSGQMVHLKLTESAPAVKDIKGKADSLSGKQDEP